MSSNSRYSPGAAAGGGTGLLRPAYPRASERPRMYFVQNIVPQLFWGRLYPLRCSISIPTQPLPTDHVRPPAVRSRSRIRTVVILRLIGRSILAPAATPGMYALIVSVAMWSHAGDLASRMYYVDIDGARPGRPHQKGSAGPHDLQLQRDTLCIDADTGGTRAVNLSKWQAPQAAWSDASPAKGRHFGIAPGTAVFQESGKLRNRGTVLVPAHVRFVSQHSSTVTASCRREHESARDCWRPRLLPP